MGERSGAEVGLWLGARVDGEEIRESWRWAKRIANVTKNTREKKKQTIVCLVRLKTRDG
jgi:hypothetical protein